MVVVNTNMEGYTRAQQLLAECPEIICGGFPCQDISAAGRGAGITGSRSGFWRQMLSTIRLVRPLYVIVENVAMLLNRGMGTVLGDLATSGYDAEWDCIPACAVGADHIRDRIWIIANDTSRKQQYERWPNESQKEMGKNAANALRDGLSRRSGSGAHSENEGRIRERIRLALRTPPAFPRGYREHKPVMGRGIHGLPNRMDRIKGLGNSVVPQIPEIIGASIMEQQRTKGMSNHGR